VRVELAPYPAVERTVVLAEGMRFRLVSVEFVQEPRREASTEGEALVGAETANDRRVPTLVYPLVGLGVLGLGGFIAFGSAGKSEQRDLRETCAPACSPSDEKSMKTLYALADTSLAIGAASLIGAGVIYFSGSKRASPAVSVGTGAVGRGAWGATLTVHHF
jgi:hypothetical protein